MACLRTPESERVLPNLMDKLEIELAKLGLEKDAFTVRMTGCPNGCARPYLAEIGFVGKAPGLYNVYMGAGFAGDRLNKLFKESLNEAQILETLTPIIQEYAKSRKKNERFGDFVIRKNYVKSVKTGKDFHS